jgi:hypothetical protein
LFICTGYGNAVNCRESSAVCLVMKSKDSTCLLCVVAAVTTYLLGGKPSLCVAHNMAIFVTNSISLKLLHFDISICDIF